MPPDDEQAARLIPSSITSRVVAASAREVAVVTTAGGASVPVDRVPLERSTVERLAERLEDDGEQVPAEGGASVEPSEGVDVERLVREIDGVPIFRRPLRVGVVRPDDLLVLEFELVNLHVDVEGESGDPPEAAQVTIARPDEPAYLVVHLPPQNIGERAFFETAEHVDLVPATPAEGQETPTDPPVQTRIADTSRLAFRVPADAGPIPFTIEGLLEACTRLELSVAATARPPSPPTSDIDLMGLVTAPRWVRAVEEARVGPDEPGAEDVAQTLMAQARSLRWREGAETELRLTTPLLRDGRERELSGAVEAAIEIGGLGRAVFKPRIAEPGPTETAIEAPFRLVLSPNAMNGWAHRTDPATGKSLRVELWHTRLGTRRAGGVVEGPDFYRKLRAVWARSGRALGEQDRPGEPTADKPIHENEPFRMSLDAFDRWDVVHLTSDYNLLDDPQPVDVANFMLTSLGAWIDTRGQWDLPANDDYPDDYPSGNHLAVEEWKHRGTMGRDHYVKVVYKGFLFPFGHRASLIKVTERKFHGDREGNPAYLRQRMFIVVRQPLKEFDATGLMATDDTPLISGERLYDRQFPFSSVRITTLITPNLDKPEDTDYNNLKQSLFWPTVNNELFRFHLVGVDIEGNTVEFTAPLVFADTTAAWDKNALLGVRADYENRPEVSRVVLSGQKVAYAESDRTGDTSFESDAVTFGAEVPDSATPLGDDHPLFYPCMRRSEIRVPAIKQFTGNVAPSTFGYAGAFLKEGAHGGFGGANKGHVFFEVDGDPVTLDFGGSGGRSGGLLQPNIGIRGLSRKLGPVSGASDLDKITGGDFDPADFFSLIKAKLFGVLDLKDVIQAVGLDDLDAVPKFVSEQFTAAEAFVADLDRVRTGLDALQAAAGAQAASIQNAIDDFKGDYDALTADVGDMIKGAGAANLQAHLGELTTHLNAAATVVEALPPDVGAARATALSLLQKLQSVVADAAGFATRLAEALGLADELKMRFEWKPKLQSWPKDKPIFIASNNGRGAELTLAAEIHAKSKLNPEPTIDVVCRLDNFSLDLVGSIESFIRLHFKRIEFLSSGGTKSDVNVEFEGLEFVGPLSFVEALRQLIPLDGFSDPPALEVSEKGIEASFSMALPSIAFGVFSLQNLSLGAGFKVPFVGDPLSVRFAFCERESPFLLTVSMFGGGGFFGIEIDPGGVKMLEASFEFGASLAMDFGVASGGVHVMAGIYFKIQDEAAELTGYLRIGGNVEVLGIVSVSIELNMSLTYESASGKCIGRATLSIEIDIAFFSMTVEISCERKFAGSNGDPSFAQLMAPEPGYDPWDEYCEAFA